ncbi:MAG: hypothetical protein JJE25_11135 [Bacteroidia bacterium]|nr:hypothetical protein [Bacteroidia bacterium]
MKKIKRHVKLNNALLLVSILSISFGATAIISTHKAKEKNPSFVNHQSFSRAHLVGLIKYEGEWIQVMELPELTIVGKAL